MPTARAKSMIAAVAAVLLAVVTAWPTVTAGQPLRLVDLLPVAVALVGAVQTHLIPNVPRLPWAKAVISGASAVLSALSTLVAADPSGLTAVKIVTVVVGALLVWYVPELAPVMQVATDTVGRPKPTGATGRPAAGVEGRAAVTEALRELAQTAPRPPVPAYRPPAPAGPATTELPAQAGKPPAPAAAAVEPTPIADAALAAAQTVVLPAVTG